MKYYQHTDTPNNNIGWHNKPLPSLNDIPLGHALVNIKAFGINRADVLQKMGKYPNQSTNLNTILGLEISGEICLMHEADKNNVESTNIMAIVDGGAYASHIILPLHQCMLMPKHLSFIQAAALPEAIATVWHALFNVSALKKYINENNNNDNIWIYINAASSGIGTIAIQMCLTFGLNVIASTSSMQKLEELKAMMPTKNSGELHIFCTQEQNLEQICARYSIKIHYCLDMLGDLNALLPCMHMHGCIVSIAFLQGAKANINIAHIMQKQITYTGTMLRLQSAETKINLVHDLTQYVLPKIQEKRIKPIVYQVYMPENIEQAHTDLLLNEHIGKLVVDMYKK